MPPSSQRNRIRQSWQAPPREGPSAKLWLIARRLTASLIALALIAWCVFLLFKWVTVDKTYLVFLSASAYSPEQAPPIAYAFGDFAVFQRLASAFARHDILDPSAHRLTESLLLEKIRGQPEWNIRPKDTLVVYLAAYGIVENGEPCLLCEPEKNGGQLAKLPVSRVLKELKAVPSRAKLLILDAGRQGSRFRDGRASGVGPIANTFPKLLDDAVQQAGDERLWVLTANDSFERSHVSPALGQSIFASMVASGLAGAADTSETGNKDRQISLAELEDFVRASVSSLVSHTSDQRQSQSPHPAR
jgi:hypothetical protein